MEALSRPLLSLARCAKHPNVIFSARRAKNRTRLDERFQTSRLRLDGDVGSKRPMNTCGVSMSFETCRLSRILHPCDDNRCKAKRMPTPDTPGPTTVFAAQASELGPLRASSSTWRLSPGALSSCHWPKQGRVCGHPERMTAGHLIDPRAPARDDIWDRQPLPRPERRVDKL